MTQLDRKDFCCDDIHSHLIGPDEDGCEIQLKYFSDIRDYAIPYKPRKGGGYQLISFCPWCGSKLPSSLDEKMVKILKNEYRYDFVNKSICDYKIPKEFKTDEWWKKRGL